MLVLCWCVIGASKAAEDTNSDFIMWGEPSEMLFLDEGELAKLLQWISQVWNKSVMVCKKSEVADFP